MLVHGLLVECVDLRRLGGSAGGSDVLGDVIDRRKLVPGEKHLGPLAREGACHGAADPASGSVDDRDLVLQHHLWLISPITASSVVSVIPTSVLISPSDVPGSASGFG
jgi:hypothetical protein